VKVPAEAEGIFLFHTSSAQR